MKYYYVIEGRRYGPFSLDEMKAKIQSRELGLESLVWKEGLGDWVEADELPEFSETIGAVQGVTSNVMMERENDNHKPKYTNVPDNTKMFRNCLRFKGRARRTEYWIICVSASIYGSIWGEILETYDSSNSLPIIFIITWLFILWLVLSVRTRRCHDLGHNGFWQFIPFYGVFLALSPGKMENNKYGSPAKYS